MRVRAHRACVQACRHASLPSRLCWPWVVGLMHWSCADRGCFTRFAAGLPRVWASCRWAFGYNMVCIPIAAGVLYPSLRWQLPPYMAGETPYMAAAGPCRCTGHPRSGWGWRHLELIFAYFEQFEGGWSWFFLTHFDRRTGRAAPICPYDAFCDARRTILLQFLPA